MLDKILQEVKKHSPTILCLVASGGVAATAILTAKGTPKAIERHEKAKKEKMSKKDTLITVAPAYIPAFISGTLTVACIFGANILNKHQQAAITSAYALLNESYTRYKNKVIELCGRETHERIMRELAVEKAKDTNIIVPGFIEEGYSLGFEGAEEETLLFYDSFSERYFESTISRVLEAEYHLNRNFVLGMSPCLNDFYDLLGLEHTTIGDKFGWCIGDGDYYWIDFDHIRADVDDGLPCYIIECSAFTEPTDEYF